MKSTVRTTGYRLNSKALAFFIFVYLITFLLVLAEMNCMVHLSLPKQPINQFRKADDKLQETSYKSLLS